MEIDGQEKQLKNNHAVEIFLLVIGVSALILGFLRFNSTINNVLNQNKTDNKNYTDYQEQDLQEILDLQNRDTDNDSLSDYDEINIYRTSPYLDDTDSDGYSDKQEIENNEDPLCPRGQKCGVQSGDNQQNDNTKNSLKNNIGNFDQFQPTNNNNSSGSEKFLSGQASLNEIKQMLLQAGLPIEEINKIPDNEIVKMYYETVAETGSSN